MSVQQTISEKLAATFQPEHLSVDNESHMHNVPAGSESHFRVVVVSDSFAELKLIARHRAINKALATELAGPIHALALHTFTPDEWQARNQSAGTSPQCRGGSEH